MSQETPQSGIPAAREITTSDLETEKDQYSLDEMMKALREKEREKEEKGEVVTRSDGSVARKVKRRRRRSDQPEQATPEKEKKNLLFKVILATSLVLGLFLVGLFLLFSHNSKGHREKLEQMASDWTGAEVELSGYKRLPFSLRVNAAEFAWPAASYLKDLKVTRIDGDANFYSLFGARPGGLQIGGNEGTLMLGMPTTAAEVGQTLEEDDFPFSFEQYYCQALDVSFGEGSSLGLKGASVSLRHVSNEGGQLTIDQGSFLLQGWKPFPVSSGLMTFDDGAIDLKLLSLDQPPSDDTLLNSNLKISGRIPLAAGEKVHLTTETEYFSLSSLVGTNLARFFSGVVVESSGDISYTMGESEIEEIFIRFTADRVKVSSFPFLANMAELFPDRQLEELEFNSGLSGSAIKGILRVRPEGIALEKLEMAQKGNIQFRGGVIISKAGKIGGKIDLAINRVFVLSNPSLVNSPIMKGSEKSGYVNVSFRLGGTLSRPEDTFLSEIGLEAALPGFTNEPKIGDEDLWDELNETEEELMPDILRIPGDE